MTGTHGVKSGSTAVGPAANLIQALSVSQRQIRPSQPATNALSTAIQNGRAMLEVSEKAAGFVDLTVKRSILRDESSVSQDKSSRIAMVAAETVLPSPAPSDDIYIYNTEPADSENLRDDEDVQAEAHAKQLKELADSFGAIKQLMEHIHETTGPTSSNKSEPVTEYTGEVGGALPKKRNFEGEIIPHKDAQMLPGSSSESSSQRPLVRPGPLMSAIDVSPRPENLVPTLPSAPPTIRNSVVSRLDFGGLLQILENRIERVKNSHTGIEAARLRLLKKACFTHDTGYLILHQLYCLRVNKYKKLDEFSDLTQEHSDGLMVISHLLLRNDQMTDDAVRWFESFPRPLTKSLKTVPEVCQAYEKVKIGLVNFAREWHQFKTLCQQRKIPPLVDELLSVLSIDSPVLQQVIFRAVKREYWVGEQDQCYREGEQLFEQNQRGIQERDPRICTSQPHVVAYNQPFIYEYRRVWFQHIQHAYQPNVDPQHCPRLGGEVSPSQHAHYGTVAINGNGPRSGSLGTYANAIRPRPSLSIDIDDRHSRDASATVPIGQPGRKQVRGSADKLPLYPRPGYSAPPTPTVPSNAIDMPTGQIASVGPSKVTVSLRHPHVYPLLSPGCTNPTRPSVIAPASVPGEQQSLASTNSFVTDHPVLIRPLPNGQITGLGQRVGAELRQNSSSQYRQHNITQQPVQQNRPGVRSCTDPRPLVQRSSHSACAPNRSITDHLPHRSPWPSPQFNSSSTSLHIASPVPLGPNAPAINQVQDKNTVMTLVNGTEKIDDAAKHHYFQEFAMKPVLMESIQQYFEWTLHISEGTIRTLMTTAPQDHNSSGSWTCAKRLVRLRMVKIRSSETELTEDQWTVAPSFWPRNIAVSLNGIGLYIRQKAQRSNVTPFDLSQCVKEGDNKLSVSVIGPHDDPVHGHFAAVEILQVVDDETIKSNIARLTTPEALKRLSNLSSTPDPDVQVVDSPLVVDMTDPYTSRIYDTPVRSLHCQHHQCFDLDNFLRTRNETSKSSGQPEDFRCPICKSDARPVNLVVDEYFVKVREELEHAGRLDARAIIIDETGGWRVNDNEENGEFGDGSSISGSQLKGPANVANAEGTLRKESIYINLDD